MSLFSSNEEHFCTPFALHNQTNTRQGQIESSRLEPENEYGNVEYKLRLTDPTPGRIERLVTQLKWRIREGNGEAIIFLGVKDNGTFVGLTQDEIRLSLHTLERMSAKIGATMSIVKERIVEQNFENRDESNSENMIKSKSKSVKGKNAYEKLCKDNLTQHTIANTDATTNELRSKKYSLRNQKRLPLRKVIQVLVKRKTHEILEELRIAVLGPTDSGKSSLLGVLSHGEFDNGRGSARLNLFRHRHEVRSGHTSSISQEIFGFNCHGQPLTYHNCLNPEEIIESSSRVVTVIDLAGHQRYFGTTLFGLGSHSPDLVLIVINALSPITTVTTDHISLAFGMDRAKAVVINKIDLATDDDQETCYEELIRAIQTIQPQVMTHKIASINDAIIAGPRLSDPKYLPIFFTSCVSGSGLEILYAFFNQIPTNLNPTDLDCAINKSSELQVDETFEVPGIGSVVSGLITEGIIREGDEMLLGPDDQGKFSNVTIVSLQRHKIPCNHARAGQKCTIAITANDVMVRKGMVMKEFDQNWMHTFPVCIRFEAKIKFISNEKHKLSCGSHVSVYIGNVKQTCQILSLDKRQNDLLSVGLKLTKRPEYIREGSRIIIRLASTKAIGTVSKVESMLGADSSIVNC